MRPPTRETVDRRLKQAGHKRHDGRTRMTRYSTGYTVDEPRYDNTVVVSWDDSPGDNPGTARTLLAPLAATLEAAGYRVVRGETVTNLGGEVWRWPCLVVTSKEAPDA